MVHTLVVHAVGWDDRHAPPKEGPSKIARSRALVRAAHSLLFGLSTLHFFCSVREMSYDLQPPPPEKSPKSVDPLSC
jgi:hypothetical protein